MQDLFYFSGVPESNWGLVNIPATAKSGTSILPNNNNPYITQLNKINTAINTRLANDLHSNLVVYISTHGVPNNDGNGSGFLQPNT